MIGNLLFLLTLLSALGCALMAGVFFAFSAFVMRALVRLPPAQGIAAMQSINIAVINPWFLSPFFGTAAACAVLVVVSVLAWRQPGALYLLIGGLLYLIGTFLVTLAFNVPRNEALAAISSDGPDAATQWRSYVGGWTAWNHVRTAAGLLAAAALGVALCGLRVRS